MEHIHFNSQGHVYLGTINGVYRSTDVGLTWEKVNSGLGGVKVATMTIDAADDLYIQTTYPGQYDGYYRSQDGGDTWQALDFYDHIGWTMEFLSIGGSFYAIGSDYGVTFSDNDGETWAQINTGIDNDESYYQLYDLHLGGNGHLYLTGRYGYRTNGQVTEPCNEGFLDIGGDGIDVSASELVGTQLVFVQIKDKAVSVGEASRAELVDIFVKGAGIGIASKDLSFVTVERVEFEDIAHFALASYQKKPE